MEPRIPKLEEIYDKIEVEEGKQMSQVDGYRWGLDYLQDVIKQIEKLELLAVERNDPIFYNNVKMSAQRAKVVEQELQAKLDGAKFSK